MSVRLSFCARIYFCAYVCVCVLCVCVCVWRVGGFVSDVSTPLQFHSLTPVHSSSGPRPSSTASFTSLAAAPPRRPLYKATRPARSHAHKYTYTSPRSLAPLPGRAAHVLGGAAAVVVVEGAPHHVVLHRHNLPGHARSRPFKPPAPVTPRSRPGHAPVTPDHTPVTPGHALVTPRSRLVTPRSRPVTPPVAKRSGAAMPRGVAGAGGGILIHGMAEPGEGVGEILPPPSCRRVRAREKGALLALRDVAPRRRAAHRNLGQQLVLEHLPQQARFGQHVLLLDRREVRLRACGGSVMAPALGVQKCQAARACGKMATRRMEVSVGWHTKVLLIPGNMVACSSMIRPFKMGNASADSESVARRISIAESFIALQPP